MNTLFITGIYILYLPCECMTRSLKVTDEVHEKLMILRGVMVKKNVSDVIIRLMLIREYDEAFFERVREKGLV